MAILLLILLNINSWNAGAKGAPCPPNATSLRLKSATTGMPVFAVKILGSPSCIEKGYAPVGACHRVCPCKPMASMLFTSMFSRMSSAPTACVKSSPRRCSNLPICSKLLLFSLTFNISAFSSNEIGYSNELKSVHSKLSISHRTTSTPSRDGSAAPRPPRAGCGSPARAWCRCWPPARRSCARASRRWRRQRR